MGSLGSFFTNLVTIVKKTLTIVTAERTITDVSGIGAEKCRRRTAA